jgi:hypothetical protein
MSFYLIDRVRNLVNIWLLKEDGLYPMRLESDITFGRWMGRRLLNLPCSFTLDGRCMAMRLLPGIEHMERETECFQNGIEHLFIWEENKIWKPFRRFRLWFLYRQDVHKRSTLFIRNYESWTKKWVIKYESLLRVSTLVFVSGSLEPLWTLEFRKSLAE